MEYVSHMGLYSLDCSPKIFSREEIHVIEKWGHWFNALLSGELKPFTDAQVRFIRVMNREVEPQTVEEKAWFKYLGRKTVEKKFGDRLKVRYEAEDDTFYSIDDKRKMNMLTYSTIAQNHHKGLSER
jgi:uncharacterized protein